MGQYVFELPIQRISRYYDAVMELTRLSTHRAVEANHLASAASLWHDLFTLAIRALASAEVDHTHLFWHHHCFPHLPLPSPTSPPSPTTIIAVTISSNLFEEMHFLQ
jgi:hypothetical protein